MAKHKKELTDFLGGDEVICALLILMVIVGVVGCIGWFVIDLIKYGLK